MLLKNGTLPGFWPVQNGHGSLRYRFWAFSRSEQKSQKKRRYGRDTRYTVTAANFSAVFLCDFVVTSASFILFSFLIPDLTSSFFLSFGVCFRYNRALKIEREKLALTVRL